jgi:decaprenylphospho-beta-D-ribofuranose 2-oxidase
MPGFVETEISGWGGYPRVRSRVYRAERVSDLSEMLLSGNEAQWITRGEGRSYGDAATNGDRAVVDVRRLNRLLNFDQETGMLECEAGVTVEELLAIFVPRGWFPPITPGTKFVTLGGAFAADVHGKNHHKKGAMSAAVHSIALLLPGGETLTCSRNENADLFWATAGGMGLTGTILTLRLPLLKIQSASVDVTTVRARNIDEAMSLFGDLDEEYEYSAAWLDGFSTGKDLGRSVLLFGNHSQEGELVAGRPSPFDMPRLFPSFLLNNWSVKCFNTVYFYRHPRNRQDVHVHYEPYFYPLDRVGNWNRAYGRNGFLQYQFVVPDSAGLQAVSSVLEMFKPSEVFPYLVVLKRFGPQEGLLSFPMAGYTLALDFPNLGPQLFEFLDRVDQVVVENGGRVYLAKDSRMKSEMCRSMYAGLDKWLETKKRVDPDNRLSSDLSRRLCITS